MKQGWLQSVIICAPAFRRSHADRHGQGHQCRFIFEAHGDATEPPGDGSPPTAPAWMPCIWDCDSLQDSPTLWPVLRRRGTDRRWRRKAFPALPTVRLKTVDATIFWRGQASGACGGVEQDLAGVRSIMCLGLPPCDTPNISITNQCAIQVPGKALSPRHEALRSREVRQHHRGQMNHGVIIASVRGRMPPEGPAEVLRQPSDLDIFPMDLGNHRTMLVERETVTNRQR